MNRVQLRAQLWEVTGGICEFPLMWDSAEGEVRKPCGAQAEEMAHIVPRGMGHTGYRDHLSNVMAACYLHARVTDDLSDPGWAAVPGEDRVGLAAFVKVCRRRNGWDIPDGD